MLYGGLTGFKAVYSVGDVHYAEIRLATPHMGKTQNDLLLLFRVNRKPLKKNEVEAIIQMIDPQKS